MLINCIYNILFNNVPKFNLYNILVIKFNINF